MAETAHTARGIADADTGVLLVGALPKPGAGRVDLIVRNGLQGLGPADWLHAVKGLVTAGVVQWPHLSDTVATVVESARAGAGRAA